MTTMIMQQMIQQLHEVNMLLSNCRQGVFSFEQALSLSLFYRDFSDTNMIVEEAESLAEKDAEQLLKLSSALFSESEIYRPLTGHHCCLWTLNPFSRNT